MSSRDRIFLTLVERYVQVTKLSDALQFPIDVAVTRYGSADDRVVRLRAVRQEIERQADVLIEEACFVIRPSTATGEVENSSDRLDQLERAIKLEGSLGHLDQFLQGIIAIPKGTP